MAKLRLPSRFIVVNNRGAGTVATRSIRNGRFTGRRRVGGTGDKTKIRQVKEDVDVNHDGKTDFFGGTVLGRTTSVRGSGTRRAYERNI